MIKTRQRLKINYRRLVISLVILALGALAGYWAGYDIGYERATQDRIDSFEDCRTAGYPIQESYPEVCTTPDGRAFSNSP